MKNNAVNPVLALSGGKSQHKLVVGVLLPEEAEGGVTDDMRNTRTANDNIPH